MATLHQPSSEPAAVHVAITGATGLLGSALANRLRSRQIVVQRVRRGSQAVAPDLAWQPERGVANLSGLNGVRAVVHLSGEPIAERWTASHKKAIRDSRVGPTSLLARSLASLPDPPKVLLSASAIGIYGDRGNEELDESSAPGNGFLAEVAQAWELAT